MANAKSGSLLPYIFYFLIGHIITLALLIFFNRLGLRNFVFIEPCWIGSSLASYLFYIKYKRAMFFAEQSKITWVNVIILFLLSIIGFEVFLHLDNNLEQKLVLLSKSLGIVMVIYGLWLSFTFIFIMSFLKISANIIHKNSNNHSKIGKTFLTISLTIFIADIITNFLIN